MIGRAATLGAIAMTLAAGRSDPLAGRIAGPPRQCFDLFQNAAPQIVDSRTILYSRTAKRIWRTGPTGACPALRPMTTLVVEVYGGQICAGDRFRVVESTSHIPSGYCRFQRFVPYDKP